jgi:hypothetical protein
MAIFVLIKFRQAGVVVTFANFGPKENGGRPEMTVQGPRIRPGRVAQGFCRIPCFAGLREARDRPLATQRPDTVRMTPGEFADRALKGLLWMPAFSSAMRTQRFPFSGSG